MGSIPIFTVVRPGLMTTIQDLGRPGLRGIGVATGGAMHAYSLRIANALVGNQAGAAALEITLLGPTLLAQTDVAAAIVGADQQASIDGKPIAHGATFSMTAGQTLAFGRLESAVRAYLAVAGGFDVPVALGSRSTFIRASLGGLDGRALRAGDTLFGRTAQTSDFARLGWSVSNDADVSNRPIQFIAGPHLNSFAADALQLFVDSTYTISHESDRMGIRLNGPPLPVVAPAEMVSEPVPIGAVQVPPSGQPIVLMADQQTTGGYPLIAVVIAADISSLAQRPPGSAVRFELVTLAEALESWRLQQRQLATMEAGARLRG